MTPLARRRKTLTLRKDPLTQALYKAYERTRDELGYSARRFVVALKRHGGLAVAKRILAKRGKGVLTGGLMALKDAGRPELSVEWIVLLPEFSKNFSKGELEIAAERIKTHFKKRPPPIEVPSPIIYPDDLPKGPDYKEGAVEQVLVNRYERNPRARNACLRKWGRRCKICNLLFEDMYGQIGRNFIHVHHVRPLAATRKEYRLNPHTDLVPVCPNCHSMLHKRTPPFSVYELRQRLLAPQRKRELKQ